MSAPRFIDIRALDVTYRTLSGENLKALSAIEAVVREGEFCAIVGPSGCGKSTLLKVLAGLVRPTGGMAAIAGEPVTAPRRDVGFVFQAPTLLPWLRVVDNVVLPLRVLRDSGRGRWRGMAMALLDLVGLKDFAERYPSELSGGMQQRVGMARALIHDPRVLLMDEPFGALDALTREQMNLELQKLWLARPRTVLFVTHSISEAVFLADRVLVMGPRPGKVVADIRIGLPRPRDLNTMSNAEFGAHAARIRALLQPRGSP